MSDNKSNATIVDVCTKRLTALKAYVDAKAQIAINGKKHKLADVVAIYQSCLDSRAALGTKRAEAKTALGTQAIAEQARRQADRGLKAWVTNEFGIESTEALDFGFPPPRKPTRTVEDKVNALAQSKATRAARHTMGKKEKLSIKGTLPVLTAPAAPATNGPTGPSPASQPAPGVVVVQPATPPVQPLPTQTLPTLTPTQPLPTQQTQTQNGAPAPAASANGAPGH